MPGELIKVQFPIVALDAPSQHEPPQVAVRGNVVESVVVHASVRQVLPHVGYDMLTRQRQQLFTAAEFKAQQRIAILKSLRPLRPVAEQYERNQRYT